MNQVTKASIERIRDLPMLPDVAAQVMASVSDPTSSMADIQGLIERDPALTAKLLKRHAPQSPLLRQTRFQQLRPLGHRKVPSDSR